MQSELAVNVTERQFQELVIEYAHLRGWLVHHTRPARTSKGYRTAIQGDTGFPDLVLARNGIVVFAELKTEKGRTSVYQEAWADALRHEGASRTHEVFLWRPSDWRQIMQVLR